MARTLSHNSYFHVKSNIALDLIVRVPLEDNKEALLSSSDEEDSCDEESSGDSKHARGLSRQTKLSGSDKKKTDMKYDLLTSRDLFAAMTQSKPATVHSRQMQLFVRTSSTQVCFLDAIPLFWTICEPHQIKWASVICSGFV